MPAAILARPTVAFDDFLRVSEHALGYSVARPLDASGKRAGVAERLVNYLAAMRQRDAAPAWRKTLMHHAYYSLLVAGDDVADIWAPGLVSVVSHTAGADLAVVSGTLANWVDAYQCRCRHPLWDDIATAFNAEGLGELFYRPCHLLE